MLEKILEPFKEAWKEAKSAANDLYSGVIGVSKDIYGVTKKAVVETYNHTTAGLKGIRDGLLIPLDPLGAAFKRDDTFGGRYLHLFKEEEDPYYVSKQLGVAKGAVLTTGALAIASTICPLVLPAYLGWAGLKTIYNKLTQPQEEEQEEEQQQPQLRASPGGQQQISPEVMQQLMAQPAAQQALRPAA